MNQSTRTEEMTWHALSVEEVLVELRTSPEGLQEAEAVQRLEKYGPNLLAEEQESSALALLLHQFKSPLIYILLIAAGGSLLLGEVIDAAVIFVIVLFNAALGFFQEYKAERALEALRRMAEPVAEVIREGEIREIPSEEIVPGDIIAVTTGDRIPADSRLIETRTLQVEEAALTGESVPSNKNTEVIADIHQPLADRNNMLYAGTIVSSGKGVAVVVATGGQTEAGRIARHVSEAPAKETPIQRKLNAVARLLAVVGVLVAALLVGIGYWRGFDLYTLFLTAVAAAVSFIPEGLPAIVTIVLAIGVQRMARRNAIVRKLPAVEALGSATVVCTDKTGTLTKNQMTVQTCVTPERSYQITGEGYRPEGEFLSEGDRVNPLEEADLEFLLQVAALCNDARLVEEEGQWRIVGDPTEGALTVASLKAGIAIPELQERYPRVNEVPFNSEFKYMATLHRSSHGSSLVCVKGAPERILGMSDRVRVNGEIRPLAEEQYRHLRDSSDSLAAEAYRVLAIAYKEIEPEASELPREQVENQLVFLGLAGMIDPARPEAQAAIESAREAGIRVIMITGDNPVTAKAIAASLGFEEGDVVAGRELTQMSDEDLGKKIKHVSVFARVQPHDKYRIVKALQEQGELVAMTGDGVNDAPALKLANIGISMGIAGTDVARESSEMVLADDNFATIIAAVEEGRTIFSNLRKVVQYLLSTNTGEVLTFLVSTSAGLPLPLLPVQILFVNLATDGFAMAPIAFEPKEPGLLKHPPRPPEEPVITKRIAARMVMVAVIMVVGTLGLFLYELHNVELIKARTMAFTTLAVFQLFNAFNARSSTQSVFRIGLFSNPYILMGVGFSFLLQVLVVHLAPLQAIFRTTALRVDEWGLIILVCSSIFIVEEIRKAIAPELFESHERD
jgi:P-type Ca2+ transporter type 2C